MAAEPIEIDITRSIRPLRAKLTLAKRSSAVPTMASGTMPKNRSGKCNAEAEVSSAQRRDERSTPPGQS